MIVARAFVTIACILSALSVLCLVAWTVIRTELNRIVLIVGKVLPLVSLIAGIIGVAVGIAFIVQSPSEILFKISDAAVLGITAVAGNIIGAILALMIRWTFPFIWLKTFTFLFQYFLASWTISNKIKQNKRWLHFL